MNNKIEIKINGVSFKRIVTGVTIEGIAVEAEPTAYIEFENADSIGMTVEKLKKISSRADKNSLLHDYEP